MEVIISSFLLVAASEMGDKTQLLALVLALRFRQPWAIMSGILVATLLNHGLASWLGASVSAWLAPDTLRYILAATFAIFALWILIPDKDEDGPSNLQKGAFLTTLVAFFLAEMGDKTQLATLALGAKFQNTLLVTVGTTAGMLFSDGLAVAFGEKLTKKIPLSVIRVFTALLFLGFAILIAWAPVDGQLFPTHP